MNHGHDTKTELRGLQTFRGLTIKTNYVLRENSSLPISLTGSAIHTKLQT